MKLTQAIKNEILENYCKARYHNTLQQQSDSFLQEVENIVKEHFSDFDFEGAKKFKGYISYQENVYLSEFYSERRKVQSLAEKLFFDKIAFSKYHRANINFSYPGDVLYIDTVNKKGKDLVKKFLTEIIALLEKFVKETEIINSVLLSCNSDKQLTETLPEIMPYYPKNISTETRLISLETLNKAKCLLQVR